MTFLAGLSSVRQARNTASGLPVSGIDTFAGAMVALGRIYDEGTCVDQNMGEAVRLFRRAAELGFDAVGFALATGSAQDREHLAMFISDGRHGDMAWMATTADRRADPQALWPSPRSRIVVGLNYGSAKDPMIQVRRRRQAALSVYS